MVVNISLTIFQIHYYCAFECRAILPIWSSYRHLLLESICVAYDKLYQQIIELLL